MGSLKMVFHDMVRNLRKTRRWGDWTPDQTATQNGGTSDEVCGDAVFGQRAPVIAFKKMAAGVGEHFGL